MVFGLHRLPRGAYTGGPSGEIRGNKRLANHNRWRKNQTGNSEQSRNNDWWKSLFQEYKSIREKERMSSKALASSHRSSTLFEFRVFPRFLVFNI